MISGVFPADQKPRFKLCNDGPAPQCISDNVMGLKLHERQAYRLSYQKRGPAAKPANQRHCDDASWVQGHWIGRETRMVQVLDGRR